MNVQITGARPKCDDLYRLTEILNSAKKKHHPYICITIFPEEEEAHIDIVDRLDDVLRLPDNTRVLWQWEGRFSSDFFEMTVADLKEELK